MKLPRFKSKEKYKHQRRPLKLTLDQHENKIKVIFFYIILHLNRTYNKLTRFNGYNMVVLLVFILLLSKSHIELYKFVFFRRACYS